MNNFVVYKHENKINGKVYIGLTQNLKRRWVGKCQAYSGSPVFYKALKKYGWDNFTHEIMYENLTQEQAKQKETELIKQYKSNETAYGYNLTLGGDCNIPNEEVKNKISKTQSAGMTEERKQKIKDALKDRNFSGENNPYYGKQHTQEIRNKMSANQWSKKDPERFSQLVKQNLNCGGAESRFAKKIIRLIDGKVYDTVAACAQDNNVHVLTIPHHCQNKLNHPQFMYKTDYDALGTQEKDYLKTKMLDMHLNPQKYAQNTKKIIRLCDNKIFDSLKQCCEQEQLDASTIIRHCKNKVKYPKYSYLN